MRLAKKMVENLMPVSGKTDFRENSLVLNGLMKVDGMKAKGDWNKGGVAQRGWKRTPTFQVDAKPATHQTQTVPERNVCGQTNAKPLEHLHSIPL